MDVMTDPARTLLTVEQYEALPEEPEYRTELSRGRLVREPQPGALHGAITGRLYSALLRFVEERHLGTVTNQTGFRLPLEPPSVRGPDVAFIHRDRLPPEIPVGFWPLAPDLAVEVASPSNSLADLQQKTIEYFESGVRQVWIVEPATRTVTVYRSLDEIQLIREHGSLDGDPVMPGLQLSIASLFT